MGLEDLRNKQNQKELNDYEEYQEFLHFKEMKRQKTQNQQWDIQQNMNDTTDYSRTVSMNDMQTSMVYAWLLAFTPLFGYIFFAVHPFLGILGSIVLIVVFGILDRKALMNQGYNVKAWWPWVFICTPIYLFLRASNTNKKRGPAIVGCAWVAIAIMIFIGWGYIGNVANNSVKAGFSTSKANTMSTEEFKNSCKEYDYKDILRNPSDYAGKYVKVTVGISNELNNMKGYWSALTATAIGWFGDQYVIHYDLDTKILPDDVITVYGVCEGTMNVVSVLGVQTEVPLIKARAVDLLTDDEAEKFVSDAYDEYLGDVLGDYFGANNQSSGDNKTETTQGLPDAVQNVMNNNTYIRVCSAVMNSEGSFDYKYNKQCLDFYGDFSSYFTYALGASKGIQSKKNDLSVRVGEHIYFLGGSADAESLSNGNMPWTLAVFGDEDDIQNGSYSWVWLTITNEDGSESYWKIKDDGLNFMLKKLIDSYETQMKSLK